MTAAPRLCLTHRAARVVGNVVGFILGVGILAFGAPAHRLCRLILGEGWDK